jgi:hypothetical protein
MSLSHHSGNGTIPGMVVKMREEVVEVVEVVLV